MLRGAPASSPQQRRRSELATFTAPVGGWVSNRALAIPNPDGGTQAAERLDNFFPTATGCILRRGSASYAQISNAGLPVVSLFKYIVGENIRMFGATEDTIYDISTVAYPENFSLSIDQGDDLLIDDDDNTIGENSGEGLEVYENTDGGDWVTVQFGVTGGTYLIGVNGNSPGFIFDGSDFLPYNGSDVLKLNYDARTAAFTAGSTITGGTSGATAKIYKVVPSFTPNLVALRAANANRWAKAKLTRAPEFTPVAKRLVAAKNRYLTVASATKVPWFFIAVVHERESSQSWSGSLAQGDPWNKKSTHVPAGRGPFASWEAAAIDALSACAPYAARNTDWSVGGLLTMLEQYNGLGYANKGLPSPYVWSGTDQYSRGKYVADGKFDPNAVDKQLGCAGLILAMQALDPSIQFGVLSSAGVIAKTGQPVIAAHPSSAPSVSNPAPGSVGAKLASLFSSLFKKAA